ncbi:MAG: tRNA (adenosine(37)-N6)-dimethylallyltransferase MiaA [Magnetococcales bacterium]|nr:tRNA (adenosine(37)-N6)-dimethylallyltransferase MiaA [Magnetococcales bacterium]
MDITTSTAMSEEGDVGPAIFLMGPTACGKSAVALLLARQWPLEIVNADAMQVYRYLDIGTAKPTLAERSLVPHHLFDIVDPDQPFSVGHYRRMALEVVRHCRQRGKIALFVGGSGLYLRVLERGLAAVPPIEDHLLQQQLQQQGDSLGWPVMHQQLSHVDPVWAAHVMPTDRQRIVRGLLVYQVTGRPLSDWHRQQAEEMEQQPRVQPLLRIRLDVDRALLYRRIESRFDQMMTDGLLEEVRLLWQRHYPRHLPAMKAVGYRQLLAYLDGTMALEEAIADAKQQSRRYAKRQITWLRHDNNSHDTVAVVAGEGGSERMAAELAPVLDDFFTGWNGS